MKKLLSVLLSLSMMASALPANLIASRALAEENEMTAAAETAEAEAEETEEEAEEEPEEDEPEAEEPEEESEDEPEAEEPEEESEDEPEAEESAEEPEDEPEVEESGEVSEEEPAGETPADAEPEDGEDSGAEEPAEEEPAQEETPAAEKTEPAEPAPAEEKIPGEEIVVEEENVDAAEALFECGYASAEEGTEVFANKALTEKLGEFTEDAVVYAEERKAGEDETDPADDVLEILFAADGGAFEGYIPAADAEPLSADEADALEFALESDGVKLCGCGFEAEEREPAVITGILWNEADGTVMAAPGTAEEALALPQTLTAEYSDGTTAGIPVTWVCTDEGGYQPGTTGVYAFSAQAEVPEGIALPAVNVVVFGSDGDAETQEYATSGNCGTTAVWTIENGDTLVISGTGSMRNYTETSRPTFRYHSEEITELIVMSGITSLGNCGFYSSSDYPFSNLETIDVADSCTKIGYQAFESCSSLTEADLPSVTELGEAAFKFCTSLAEVNLPRAKTLGASVFSRCTSLTDVSLPSASGASVSLFEKCTGLTRVSMPAAASVGNYAFSGCTNLGSVSLPQAASVGSYAFQNCRSLTACTLPKVRTLGASAFQNCTSLTTLVLPASLTTVGDDCFAGCDALTTVRFGGTKAQRDAISFGSGNEALENARWEYVTSIVSVSLGDNSDEVTVPGGTQENALGLPAQLTAETSDGDTVTVSVEWSCEDGYLSGTAGEYTFVSACTGTDTMVSAEMPEIVVTVYGTSGKCGTDAYWTLDEDGTLTVTGSGETYSYGWDWDEDCPWIASYNRTLITSVIVEGGITEIGDCLFKVLPNLRTLTLAPSVTVIGDSAFLDCSKMDSVSLPGVVEIGEDAFTRCASIVTLSLPCAVDIDTGAFARCVSLENLSVPEAVFLGDEAFWGCGELKSVSLPKAEELGDDAFGNCWQLESVSLSKAVELGSAFNWCTDLTTLSIPASLTYVADNCFYQCDLQDVWFEGTLAQKDAMTVGSGNDPLLNAVWHCSTAVITGFAEFENEKEVSLGTGEDALGLPGTLTAELSDGTTAEAAVGWTCAQGYDPLQAGTYVFVASYEGTEYTLGAEAELPEFTVRVLQAGNIITASNKTVSASETAQSLELGASCLGGAQLSYASDTQAVSVDASGMVTVAGGFAGKAQITIAASETESYLAVSKTVTVTVSPIANPITVSNVTKNYSKYEQNFSLNASCLGGAQLSCSSDTEEVSVDDEGNVTVAVGFIGRADITVTAAAAGMYVKTMKTAVIKVLPPKTTLTSLTNSAAGTIKPVWKKSSVVTGYQIQYGLKSDFSDAKLKTITKNTTTAVSLTGCTKGKTYYARIRTFKTVDGVRYCSSWSDSLKVKLTQ